MQMRKFLKSISAVFMAFVIAFTMSFYSFGNAIANAEEIQESLLQEIYFASDSGGKNLLDITPELTSDNKDYSIIAPDYLSSAYAKAVTQNPDSNVYVMAKTPWGAEVKVGLDSTKFSSVPLNTFTGKITVDDTDYNFSIKRMATLKSLKINETMSPNFDREVKKYDVYVPEDEDVTITSKAYTSGAVIKLNGENTKTISPVFDDNGEMEVEIEVSKSGLEPNIYTVILHKEPKENIPFFITQPVGGSYLDTAKKGNMLMVKASGSGELSYQWYKSDENSTENGEKIEGATEAMYIPEIPDIGKTPEKHIYYYCVVTNTKDGEEYNATSNIAHIKITPDPTPVVTITGEDGEDIPEDGYTCKTGDTIKLKVNAESDSDEVEILDYTWYVKLDYANKYIDLTEEPVFDLPIELEGENQYYCSVSYEYKGKEYTVNSPYIKINAIAEKAQEPKIITQPKSGEYLLNVTPKELNVVATSPDKGELSYQWQVSYDDEDFEEIDGATSDSYIPETSDEEEDLYYRCKITNTLTEEDNVLTRTVCSDSAQISFKDISSYGEELGYDELDGDGTESNPYLIKTLKDLELVRDLVNKKGILFTGLYIKIQEDISIPVNWDSIGSVDPNNSKEYWAFGGTFDGGGKTLTIEKGGKAPFGIVSKATIKNLNIYGEQIQSAGLIQGYPSYTGSYQYDETNEGYKLLYIDNVVLKSGSKTLDSGFVTGNGSGMATVFIRNSRIEDNVVIGYDKSKSGIGSFISYLNGVVNDCTSYATVYGVSQVGGIAGSKGQSMGNCRVHDCYFGGKVEASGQYAGGILGSGYIAPSAPNTPCATVTNNINSGSVQGADCVGGIFGGEGYNVECWANGIGYIYSNLSYGNVKATNGTAVGGIIGYMHGLNSYNIVEDNYYLEGSADKGIGEIQSINTSGGEYGRKDDPTGADVDKLAKAISQDDLTNGNVANLLNSAKDSSNNFVQGENGPVKNNGRHLSYISAYINGSSLGLASVPGGAEFPINSISVYAKYSDGEMVKLDNKDVEFVGFDSSKKGYIKIEANYEGKVSYIAFNVTSDAPLKITFDSDNGNEQVVKTVKAEEELDYAPEVPTKEGYVFVGWYKDLDDITTEYKSNATYTENTTYKAKYAHVEMLGTQAKSIVNDKSGIRFGTKVFNDGDEIIEKGTLILPFNLLKEGETLKLDTPKVAKSIGKTNFEKTEEYTVYLGTITNIPKSQFGRELTASAYVTYRDKAGHEYTVYAPYKNTSTSVNQLLETE
ncbi:InlB B-repeat-containing protein [Intestinibacter sp.]